MRVFHLDVFVTHEGPGRKIVPIEGECAPEIHYGFFVLGFQRVVISDYAACFGPEFVGSGGDLGEEGEFGAGGHYVEDVGVGVEGVDAVGISA